MLIQQQLIWGGGNPIEIENYLTIVALEDGLTASLSMRLNDYACEYCVDGDGNWKTLSSDTYTSSINRGQTLSFRGNITPDSSGGIGTFTISKSCNLEGNCMSMLFGDEAVDNNSLEGNDYVFVELFRDCDTIKSVSSGFLPATTLSEECYGSMFSSCTNLTTAPSLPATTLVYSCYNYMFEHCTSLTQAPELPATTLVDYCYYHMFIGCSKLNYIKAMFTTYPFTEYTSNWVKGVASTGTFVKNKNATWNLIGERGIPSGWTVQTA